MIPSVFNLSSNFLAFSVSHDGFGAGATGRDAVVDLPGEEFDLEVVVPSLEAISTMIPITPRRESRTRARRVQFFPDEVSCRGNV